VKLIRFIVDTDVGDALDTQAADTDEDVSDTQLSTEVSSNYHHVTYLNCAYM